MARVGISPYIGMSVHIVAKEKEKLSLSLCCLQGVVLLHMSE